MLLILYILFLVAIIYFMLIRPQKKRKQQLGQLIEAIQPGVEVVTVGGMFGEVKELTEHRITLIVKGGVEIEFDKKAIAKVLSK